MNGKAKILLVDSCYEADSLSQYEFVRPVQRVLERTGFSCQVCHISLLDEERLKGCDKVVLCGTALKDNEYLNHLERYTWLKEGDWPVLGICAGMQIIAAIFGGEVRSRPGPAIGLEKIEVVRESDILGPSRKIEVYHIHSLDPTLPEGFISLAGTELSPEAFSHCSLPIWGLLFHPEVRNRWILENYANL
jgi:GMP synthase (glutamine-hydrolysing)